jgi:uncharacterized membrane protein
MRSHFVVVGMYHICCDRCYCCSLVHFNVLQHSYIQPSYKYIRHPSYVGFYYWSVGTQMVLTNYFHVAIFSYAAWWFFKIRIPYEEESLLHHFGDEYMNYAKTTYIGIPFIQSPINGKVKNR